MKQLLVAILFVGCTSRQFGTAETIAPESRTTRGDLGVASNGRYTIQERRAPNAELMILEHVNENKLSNVRFEQWELTKCREELGIDTSDVQALALQANNHVDEKFAQDENGKLVFVRTQDFKAAYDAEVQFGNSLDVALREFKKLNRECQAKKKQI